MAEKKDNMNFDLFKEISFTDYYNIKKLNTIYSNIDNDENNINPEDLENNYYEKYNCKNELEKIDLEIRYIKTKLNKNPERYDGCENYDKNLEILFYIANIIKTLKPTDYKRIKMLKKCLVLIELDFEMPIGFYSVIEELIEEKKGYKVKKRGV